MTDEQDRIHRQILQDMGAEFDVQDTEVTQPDGTVTKQRTYILKSVSPVAKAVNRFFAGGETWFTGAEELQQEFKKALAAIGGEDCESCERGKLIRAFHPRVKAAIEAALRAGETDPHDATLSATSGNDTQSEISNAKKFATRFKQVPGPGGESAKGTSNGKKLLRRAFDGIKKIFGAGKTTGES